MSRFYNTAMAHLVKSKAQSKKAEPRLPLSQVAGNPAHAIRVHYDLLMAESCPQKLAADARELIRSSHGVSEANRSKALRVIDEKLRGRKPLYDLQKYLTDYMLRADGLGVVATGSRG